MLSHTCVVLVIAPGMGHPGSVNYNLLTCPTTVAHVEQIRKGAVVTLEVCTGVAPTLIVTTVPCPHINQVLSLPIGPSIHVGRAKTSLSGISPNRGMALLTHHGYAPCGGCLYAYCRKYVKSQKARGGYRHISTHKTQALSRVR